jgi:hypothetical protein
VVNFIYSYPRRIETSLEGLSFHLDDNDTKQHQLVIKGWTYNHLFRASTFKGTILIDGIKMFDFKTTTGKSELIALEADDLITYGTLIFDHNYKEVVINVHENNTWGSSDGLVMVFPSSTKENALRVLKNVYALDDFMKNIKMDTED